MKNLLLLCVVVSVSASYAQPKDLDAYIENVRNTFDVPGLAVSIVKDGKLVMAKGYGVRRLGAPERVDAHTLFGIASNTKVFTSTALALLVEEGRLAWDAPVIQYLPWFQLADPYVTRELTIRDLLVHRSGLGLGAGDLLWWPPSTYNRHEIARRLKFIPLATTFRSTYAYDNVLYLVAGEVIEAITGQSWEQFISSRILTNVGMTESTVHYPTGPGVNLASPHAKVGSHVQAITPFTSDNTNPAGGINSNVTDMAKWAIVQMDSGRTGTGSRLFSSATTRQLWSIVTPIPVRDPPAELAPLRANFSGYALGLGIRDYRGKKVVSHTGGLPGYLSKVVMIPELKLGVVVLTNQESGAAFESISYHILDYYLGAAPWDWIGAYQKIIARNEADATAAEKKDHNARNAASGPSLALEKYAGSYNDPWYGDIVIAYSNNQLQIRFSHTPGLEGDLEHWQHDTFIAHWRDRELRADAYVTFSLNPDGSIDHAKMKAVSNTTDFSFDFQDLLLTPGSESRK
jgi:CubicO group peptidase (beta-lactamase class C family)